MSLFAAVALGLAMSGLLALMSYTVVRRTHEIGVRMALGAQRDQVLRLVLKRGIALACSGLFAGVIAAFGLTRFMRSMLFGVTPNDPAAFLAGAALLIALACLACAIPAYRAAKVDPMLALRYE